MKLTWRFHIDQIFGGAFMLEGLPDGSFGNVHFIKDKGRFIATAFIAGKYFGVYAKSWQSAMKCLNKQIDQRSIGLFNEDVIEFETDSGR